VKEESPVFALLPASLAVTRGTTNLASHSLSCGTDRCAWRRDAGGETGL